ncbi:hypothetical protein [Streptomyces sp. NPDC048825]|uniref:hypothetical protein n=1 Tax=Streptomyces sp. NPDC048825 TaxID=3365592 RepID=UPI00371595AB
MLDGNGHERATGEGQEAGEKGPAAAELHDHPGDERDGCHEQDGYRVGGEAKDRAYHRLLQPQMPVGRHQESQALHHTAPGTGGVLRSGLAGSA